MPATAQPQAQTDSNSIWSFQLPSNPTFIAESEIKINVSNELTRIKQIIDTGKVFESIAAQFTDKLGLGKKSNSRPQDNTVPFREALCGSVEVFLKKFFSDDKDWQVISDELIKAGSGSTHLSALIKKYDPTNKEFAGSAQEFSEDFIGGIKDALIFFLSNKPPYYSGHFLQGLHLVQFNEAFKNLSYKVGLTDPNNPKRRLADEAKAKQLLIDSTISVLDSKTPSVTSNLAAINLGNSEVVKVNFEADKVHIENTLTNIKITFQPSSTATNDEILAIKELIQKLTDKTKTALTPRITEEVPDLAKSISAKKLEDMTILLMKYCKDGVSFSDLSQAPHFFTELTKSTGIPLSNFTSLSSFTNPAKRITDLEHEKNSVILPALNATPATPITADIMPHLLNTIKASENLILKRNSGSTGIIDKFEVRCEFGEYFVDLNCKDKNGNGALISFRLNSTDGEKQSILQKVSQIAKDIDTETTNNIAESKTMLSLLALGQIQTVKGITAPIAFEKINWLGGFLAPDAEIKNVTFEKSNIDLSGVRTQLTSCSFSQCRVHLELEDAKIIDTIFDKHTVLFGSISGEFNNGELHGNAYALVLSALTITSKNINKSFRGGIFNRNALPEILLKASTRLTEKRLQYEQAQIEERFNKHAILGLIHHYSEDSLLTHLGGILNTTWKIDQNPSAIKLDQSIILSTHYLAVATVSDEIIDIYPPKTEDILAADADTEVLRILIDSNGKMHFVRTTKGELANYKLAADAPIYPNLLVYDMVLKFTHYGLAESDNLNSTAVTIP